jgi:Fe2+ or Zn2+ uptake regulation protein
VADLHEVAVPQVEEVAGKILDYHITGCRLEFTGICPDCGTENPDARERG